MANLKKDEDFDIYIKKRCPQIQWEQCELFIESHSNEDFKKMSDEVQPRQCPCLRAFET
jgi:hypothetical protein